LKGTASAVPFRAHRDASCSALGAQLFPFACVTTETDFTLVSTPGSSRKPFVIPDCLPNYHVFMGLTNQLRPEAPANQDPKSPAITVIKLLGY
jgi:hypothetical protein